MYGPSNFNRLPSIHTEYSSNQRLPFNIILLSLSLSLCVDAKCFSYPCHKHSLFSLRWHYRHDCTSLCTHATLPRASLFYHLSPFPCLSIHRTAEEPKQHTFAVLLCGYHCSSLLVNCPARRHTHTSHTDHIAEHKDETHSDKMRVEEVMHRCPVAVFSHLCYSSASSAVLSYVCVQRLCNCSMDMVHVHNTLSAQCWTAAAYGCAREGLSLHTHSTASSAHFTGFYSPFFSC